MGRKRTICCLILILVSLTYCGAIKSDTIRAIVKFAGPALSVTGKITSGDTLRTGSTSYAQLDTNNGLILGGNATVWDDVGDIKLDNVRNTGVAGSATWTTTGLGFSKNQFAIGDSSQGSTEIFHKYKTGDSAEFHFHWFSANNEAGVTFVKWSISVWIFNNDDSVTFAGSITKQDTISASSKVMTHRITTFGRYKLTGVTMGAKVIIVIKRIAASPTTNPATNPFGSTIGMHMIIDMMGSKGVYTK